MVHEPPAITRARMKGEEAQEAGVSWAAAMLDFEQHAE
jgi:hypothetical protein